MSTADDWLAFARLLLNGGEANGRRLLRPASVSRMTTNHLTTAQRDAGALFLEGQGWGYGGQVDVTPADPWNVPGRYGSVGGSGTAAHLVPSTGTVTILLTQVAMEDPTPSPADAGFLALRGASLTTGAAVVTALRRAEGTRPGTGIGRER
ncbi:serine hydrolase domain-containing protein [Streptomyces collinus]|uniref:hypothetical protein n=1 Tax=Streptomyces collinus TaxID=42684 RepID=UPI0036A7D38B